jgi:phage terminase small subunit
MVSSKTPKLTAQQEKFCQCIADGMTQADAYRASYKVGNLSPANLYAEASKLAKHPKVAPRLAELQGALQEKALWTREDSVQALSEIARDGRPVERVADVKELNSMHGFNAPVKTDLTLNIPKTIRLVALSGD